MNKHTILMALVLAAPAFAHHPAGGGGQGEPHPQILAQAPDRTIREIQREQRNPATPYVPEQNRDAGQADAAGIDDAAGLLYAAQTSLRSNRRGQAIEFMERAESRLLNRSTPAPLAGEAVSAGPVPRIAAARAAVVAGNVAKAQDEIAAALEAMSRPRARGRRG